jgi:hypothetical protein
MSRADDLWNEVHVGLRDHPKTARLRRRLGVGLPAAIGSLVLLWAWAVRYAPDGDLSKFDPDVLADAAGWEDEPGQFVRALISAGFVDEDLTIHDWHAYAGRLMERRAANAERMRKARANGTAFAHAAPDDRDTSGARAAHVQGLPDRTGPDLTGPDRTTTPQPPPHAEGGRDSGDQRGRRRSGGERSAPSAPPEVLAAPTPADEVLWASALAAMSVDVTPANAALLGRLELAGRGPDGGLRLRAPPRQGLGRFRALVVRALSDAGDAAGTHAAIV